jgi:hypothetical protein
MIVYRRPREPFGGGVLSRAGVWGGTLAAAPNNTVNRLVCTASAESLACCAVLPPPETTIAWTARGR